MKCFNAVTISGNVGKIIVSQPPAEGQTPRLVFSICCHHEEGGKSQDIWVDVTAFGAAAVRAAAIVAVGRMVCVAGRLSSYTKTMPNEQKVQIAGVVAESVASLEYVKY